MTDLPGQTPTPHEYTPTASQRPPKLGYIALSCAIAALGNFDPTSTILLHLPSALQDVIGLALPIGLSISAVAVASRHTRTLESWIGLAMFLVWGPLFLSNPHG
jgi:hypothetical protein